MVHGRHQNYRAGSSARPTGREARPAQDGGTVQAQDIGGSLAPPLMAAAADDPDAVHVREVEPGTRDL